MTCSFDGCDRDRYANQDLCHSHYTQKRRGQELRPLRSKAPASDMTKDLPCTFPGCERTQYAKGLCRGHADQVRKGRELKPLRPYTKG